MPEIGDEHEHGKKDYDSHLDEQSRGHHKRAVEGNVAKATMWWSMREQQALP